MRNGFNLWKWSTLFLVGIILCMSSQDAVASKFMLHLVKQSPVWASYLLAFVLVIVGISLWRSGNRFLNLFGIALFVLAGILAYGLDFYIRQFPDEGKMSPRFERLIKDNPGENSEVH